MNPDKLFFTSDTHFGHKNVIGYARRPFVNVDAMDYGLIELWNKTVPPDGVVYHLGDFSFHGEERTIQILDALHGKIHLIAGNHDAIARRRDVAVRFASAPKVDPYEIRILRVEGVKIVLSHFPQASWYAAHHGAWHLHGHSHGTCPTLGRRMDVGVECHGLTPVSFRELQPLMGMRPIECGDGHRPPGLNPLEKLLVEWWGSKMPDEELVNRAVRISPALAEAMSLLPQRRP